ncbi:MAG: carbohydrate binding domain-containing protein [Planctomycetota bacterium]
MHQAIYVGVMSCLCGGFFAAEAVVFSQDFAEGAQGWHAMDAKQSVWDAGNDGGPDRGRHVRCTTQGRGSPTIMSAQITDLVVGKRYLLSLDYVAEVATGDPSMTIEIPWSRYKVGKTWRKLPNKTWVTLSVPFTVGSAGDAASFYIKLLAGHAAAPSSAAVDNVRIVEAAAFAVDGKAGANLLKNGGLDGDSDWPGDKTLVPGKTGQAFRLPASETKNATVTQSVVLKKNQLYRISFQYRTDQLIKSKVSWRLFDEVDGVGWYVSGKYDPVEAWTESANIFVTPPDLARETVNAKLTFDTLAMKGASGGFVMDDVVLAPLE